MARRRHRPSARRSTERRRQSGREDSSEPESEAEVVDIPEPGSRAAEAAGSAPETREPDAPATGPAGGPRRHSDRTARRGSSPNIESHGKPPGRTSGRRTRSSRREAEEARDSARPSGRHRAALEKPRNYAPVIIGAVLFVIVAAALAYRPLEKSSYVKAVASGGRLGHEAASAMTSFGAGAVSPLCGVVERGPDGGKLAAAAALAQIARTGGAQEVVGAIRERLQRGPVGEVKAAYAAALSQAGTVAAVKLAASLVTDPDPGVRKCVVQGLAYGKRTPAAAAALGRALGDEDAEIRRQALDSLLFWGDGNPDLMLNAMDAAIRLESPSAHEGAAGLLLFAAGRAGDARLKVFLSDDSPGVRRLAVEAVTRSNSADPEIHKRLADILASPAEPVEVKAAALEATRAIRVAPAGPAALAILKSRVDVRLRTKAAGAVAATCPEGAIEALLGTLTDAEAPPRLRRGVLEAFYSSGRMSGKAQIAVARALVRIAEGPDETMAGLALLALRSVSGSRAVKYGPAQWRAWLGRREWEQDLVAKAHLVLDKVKAEYAEHGDGDRAIQSELFNKVGPLLNKAYGDADQWDRGAIQAAISAINKFKNSLR